MENEYNRVFDPIGLSKKKSFFLFGPRSTGKSFLLKKCFGEARKINLLSNREYTRYLKEPSLLYDEIQPDEKLVIIDEVQKLPALLDEVHRAIEDYGTRFILTGSSARKLKREGVNLLGGRAWTAQLHPLVFPEIPSFKLERYLNRGGLPRVYNSDDYQEELINYCSLYVREEIAAESLVRQIDAFARFLDVAAMTNGKEISFQNLANDTGISPRTIANYLDVLKDTLMAYELTPFLASSKRKAITRSKLYFFDVGVVNCLLQRNDLKPKNPLWGDAFEHFIVNEVRAYLSYRRIKKELSFWRTTSDFEVDLIVGQDLAVEVKATDSVQDKHLKGLRALKEEGLVNNFYLVSTDSHERKKDGIHCIEWRKFLKLLWEDRLVR